MMAEAEAVAKRQKKRTAKAQKGQVGIPTAQSSSPVIPVPRLGSPGPLTSHALALEVDPAVKHEKKRKRKKRKHREEAVSPSSTEAEAEAKRQKKRTAKAQKGQVGVPTAQSSSPVIPVPRLWSPGLITSHALALEVDPAVKREKKKKRKKRKHREEAASPSSTEAEAEAKPQKKRMAKAQKGQVGVPTALSSSPVIPEPRLGSPGLLTSQALALEVDPAVKREKKKKRKKRKHREEAASLSLSVVSGAQISSGEDQTSNAPVPGKRKQRRLKVQEQSSQSPLPLDVHPQGDEEAEEDPIPENVAASQDGNEKLENKMNAEKKQRKQKPVLTAAEKRSDIYRRLPLDQLVRPPRSPHKLLQEKFASDPWKVIVICMLLNLTQGKQVKKIVKGFFRRYPDPQTACRANPAEMAEYLTPLGLQRKKTERIQRFSKDYVEKEWTYITELCGVGKYAADAYAIFCAGRATEVVPKDHKLVDYWKYVCSVTLDSGIKEC